MWKYCNFILFEQNIKIKWFNITFAFNIKLSNSQLNELKSGIKNGTEVTLKLSSNVAGDSNEENNATHKLLSVNTQLSRFHKSFANDSSPNVKLSKTA